ncbi:MAG: PBP1A family penicillin-binding protein [Synergistaceae bacterium]|nr:PBP1A family penicillin-binding protein [Synergistaceae bacterium]
MPNNANNHYAKNGNNKQKTNIKIRRKKSSVFKTIFLLFLLFMLIGIAGSVVFGTVLVIKASEEMPTVSQLMTHRINVPSVIYDRNNEVIAKLFTENRNPVELKNISPWMIKAILAAEDSEFYSHIGISIPGIIRAFYSNVMQRIEGTSGLQGGSTITQQLARSLYLSQERILMRKIKEMLISFKLEEIYSKDKILEMYLNTVYFGRGAWGVDTAAHTYFGKQASELNIAESAILAGIMPAPNRYNPMTNLSMAKSRQSYVLDRMGTLGWLNESQVQQAKNEELEFKHIPNKVEEFNRAPYFVSHILFNDLLPKYGTDKVYGGGMEIYTTLDIRLQDKAQEVVANMKTQGALVAIEPGTGEVIALVGGKDFNESKFNRATQAYRQPGSSFKPFIYGAAIEKGLRPSDRFLDDRLIFNTPGSRKPWTPTNYDGKFHGEVTMLYALTRSLNTVPVRCIAHIGVSPVIEFARKAGITTQYLQPNLSIALGSASVTPLEMAFAFSVYANEGKRPERPLFIREIRSWTGEVLEKNEPYTVQAIRPETSWTILSMLLDAVRAGTGSNAAMPQTQVFGKTGTTNDFIDAWFIGGVSGLVTAIYAGNDDNKTLGRGQTGGVVAAPPWKQFMTFAAPILDLKPSFGDPSPNVNVDRVSICRTSGFLSVSGCPAVSLYIETGTAPTSTCPNHGGYGSAFDDNAPLLVRIDQDAEIFSLYEQQLNEYEQYEQYQPPVNNNQVVNNVDVTPGIPIPRPQIETPQSVYDERYEQLLREYGIME